MPDTLTDDHIRWTQNFTGVDLGAARQQSDADTTADQGQSVDTSADQSTKVDGSAAAAPGGAAPGGILSSIGDAVSAVGGAVAGAAEAVGGAVEGAAEAVGGAVEDGAKAVGGAVEDAAKAVGGAVEDAAKAVGGAAEAVGGAVEDAAKAVGGAVEDAAKAVGGALEDAAEAVGGAVEGAAKAVGGAVEDAAIAVGRALGLVDPPAPPKSITPPVLGQEQQTRADAAKAKLKPEDQKKYQDLLDGAKSEKEKQYLQKGLAAGHSIAELQAFEGKIAGKDEKWLQDNLSLTGNSDGKGIKQQWSMSCNATAVEAVRGEMDPIYALKMHEDNPNLTERDDNDGAKRNPNMAADQKKLLETAEPDGSSGGLARSVNDPTDPHQGRWNTDLLNNVEDSTGISYTNKKIGEGGVTVDKAVDDISADVQKGMPVPIVIGDGGKAAYAHYVIVTATDPGPPRSFSIHDPANGTTEVRTEDELKNGKIDLAGDPTKKGSGWNKLGAYEKPTPVPVK